MAGSLAKTKRSSTTHWVEIIAEAPTLALKQKLLLAINYNVFYNNMLFSVRLHQMEKH